RWPTDDPDPRLGRLLLDAGLYLGVQGAVRAQIEVEVRALDICQACLGADDPLTLTILNHLADGYAKTSQHEKAVTTWEQAWIGRARVLGSEDPETLRSLNNLANGYIEVGRYDEAIAMHEQNLGDRIRIWGPDHP